ncbi:MAG: TfoX/Sxy family protein [Alphaproteobacteria bacterium]
MASSPEFCAHVLDCLVPLGAVTARRMFSGYGLYLDRVIFAIIANDILYFKVDEQSRADYEAAASAPFRPLVRGKSMTMPYWQAPAGVLDDADELCAWARKAHAAGLERYPAKLIQFGRIAL